MSVVRAILVAIAVLGCAFVGASALFFVITSWLVDRRAAEDARLAIIVARWKQEAGL
jgi:hypothetical protein